MKKQLIIIICLITFFSCEGKQSPIGPQGESGDSVRTTGYYLTAVEGNGVYALLNHNCQISVLVTNFLGDAIRRCRIDWSIVSGNAKFYNEYTTYTSYTDSHYDLGESEINVYPLSAGLITIRATAFATGDYVDFKITGVQNN